MSAFDITLLVACVAIGLFSIISPERAYRLMQPKRRQVEFTDNVRKGTIISGIILLVLSVAFALVVFLF